MNISNWDGLRYFLAAADTGSLTAAAERLVSNQPTVGRQIDALELALGIKLFQRSVKGLSLTEEGRVIYEQAQAIQNTVIKIQRSVKGDEENISGSVRLSLPEGLSMEVLMPVLDNFYAQYPKVKLIFNLSPATANLTQGEADIAIRLFRPQEASLVVKYLGEMAMAIFTSKKYKKNHGLPGNLKELSQHRVITYGDSLSILPENQWLLEHSSETMCVLSSDSTIARLRATIEGVGISIQPLFLKKLNPDLHQLFSKEKVRSHQVWLVYHNDLRHLARVRVVVDFLSDCLVDVLSKN